MNKQDQGRFVNEVCDNLRRKLLEKVALVPDNWDGIELRRWIGDYYNENFRNVGDLSGKRKRDYNNARIINPNI